VLKRVSYNLTCGYGDINNERLAITGVDYWEGIFLDDFQNVAIRKNKICLSVIHIYSFTNNLLHTQPITTEVSYNFTFKYVQLKHVTRLTFQ
jgi:hypothetical protein